jgi:hypothetical protein
MTPASTEADHLAGLELEVAALHNELVQAQRLLEVKDAFVTFVTRQLEDAHGEVALFRDDAERYRALKERLARHPIARRASRLFRPLFH